MKVLLISANVERMNMPTLPLGLSLVSAAVRRAGHEVAFLDLLAAVDPTVEIRRAIESFSPDAIGVSVRNIDDQTMSPSRFLLEDARVVIAACREASRAPIILGGAGYSLFPDAALAYLEADLGVCGEGERSFPALLERIERGESTAGVPGVHVHRLGVSAPRTYVDDLDWLPMPDDSLWSSAAPSATDLWVPLQTRRGCPLACAYCSTPALEGVDIRFRSPEAVVGWLARVAAAGYRQFYFTDNTFNLPVDYAMALCRQIEEAGLGLAWRAIVYPRDVPEELAAAMAAAGCVEVSLGFESGNRAVLRAMHKNFEPEEVRQVSDRLAAHGIRRIGFLLLGGPEETVESVEESLDFVETLRLELINITVGVRLYPNTPLARRATAEDLLDRDDNLLEPKFYIRPGLEDHIRGALARRGLAVGGPHVVKSRQTPNIEKPLS